MKGNNMREIKFRVWDNIDYMSEPFTLQDIIERKIGFTNDCVVMQSTGLKDSNKVEIYEGDIVRETRRPPAKDELYTVEYRDEVGAFMFKDQYNDYDPYIDMGEIEVVGNIFEHPELMNNKNKIKEVK
jgi:uncharacterized phage protein (TIGR01671 family)